MAVVLDEFNFETLAIAQDLLNAGEECTLRGLNYTAKWYSNSYLLLLCLLCEHCLLLFCCHFMQAC
jgi:hypothetical protein